MDIKSKYVHIDNKAIKQCKACVEYQCQYQRCSEYTVQRCICIGHS